MIDDSSILTYKQLTWVLYSELLKKEQELKILKTELEVKVLQEEKEALMLHAKELQEEIERAKNEAMVERVLRLNGN